MKSKATLTLRLPEGTKEKIDSLAKATGRTKSFLALDAIQQYIQREAWQVDEIEAGIRQADAGEFASQEGVAAAFERLRG
jgi:RHH-type transcriptional regulator, rel operon repressor / antitoxin RelB